MDVAALAERKPMLNEDHVNRKHVVRKHVSEHPPQTSTNLISPCPTSISFLQTGRTESLEKI